MIIESANRKRSHLKGPNTCAGQMNAERGEASLDFERERTHRLPRN